MILVDTSVWIDHLRKEISKLSEGLVAEQVLSHPYVIGELALGSIRRRKAVLAELAKLPSAEIATDAEVLVLIENHKLSGTGLGYVDCHLIASSFMSGAKLWSHDKKLMRVASDLGVAFSPAR